jgi:dTDP-4-dehydrorhamnose reductase
MTIRVLVTGGGGLLATELKYFFENFPNFSVYIANKSEIDITKIDLLKSLIYNFKPDAVINCAAYTDVDGAESHKMIAKDNNVTGVKNIASICLDLNIYFIQISTASIFDSNSLEFIKGDSDPNPRNFYSETKLFAEQICKRFIDLGAEILILRPYWLYGLKSPNFTDFVIKSVGTKSKIRIVFDQFGQPTSALTLCRIIKFGIENRIVGFYPGTNSGIANRVEWAREICNYFDFNDNLITPVSQKEFKSTALRPFNTSLSHSGNDDIGYHAMHWLDALHEFLNKT